MLNDPDALKSRANFSLVISEISISTLANSAADHSFTYFLSGHGVFHINTGNHRITSIEVSRGDLIRIPSRNFDGTRLRGAPLTSHTHSIWGTLLSEKFSGNGGIEISGYEMLKGLRFLCSMESIRSYSGKALLP